MRPIILPTHPDTLLTREDLLQLLQVSRRTLTRWVATGIVPPPRSFTRRSQRWRWGDVQPCLRGPFPGGL